MQKKELIKVLLRDHADNLPKWYCDLNCFRIPDGFPIALDEHKDNREKMQDHAHMLAFHAVKDVLGEAGASRAWWMVELGRTEAEWRTWWDSRNGAIAA